MPFWLAELWSPTFFGLFWDFNFQIHLHLVSHFLCLFLGWQSRCRFLGGVEEFIFLGHLHVVLLHKVQLVNFLTLGPSPEKVNPPGKTGGFSFLALALIVKCILRCM